MADRRITQLPEKASPESDDVLSGVDSVTASNAKFPVSGFATAAQFGALAARVAALEGGGQPPVVVHTNYLGISADALFEIAEFSVSGQAPGLAIPDAPLWPDGQRRYVAFARPASEGHFSYVYYYPAGARDINNVIGAWMELPDVIMLGGEPHYVIRTRGPLRASARTRIVEAG